MRLRVLLSVYLLSNVHCFSTWKSNDHFVSRTRRRIGIVHELPLSISASQSTTKLWAGRKPLSAADRERREEDKRRRERVQDVVIGKTSARPGESDFALDIGATEREYLRQASVLEQEVYRQTEQGMNHLKMLQVEEADQSFQKVFELKPTAYLWQAGIAKFYLNQLEDAASILAKSAICFESRFGEPATEERIWRNACQLKLWSNLNKQERKRLQQLSGGLASHVEQIPSTDQTDELLSSESRKVLKTARELFDATIRKDSSAMILSRARLRSISGVYEEEPRMDKKMWKLQSWFYLGLWHDAMGDVQESQKCMKMALRLTPSAGKAPDIVHTLPMMHMAQRDWFDDDDDLESDLFDKTPKKKKQAKKHLMESSTSVPEASEPTNSSERFPNADPVFVDSLKDGIDDLIVEELREALQIRGISIVGSKAQLQAKLFESLMIDAGFGPNVGFQP